MKVVIDDFRLERMDVYTDPLNDKIKRQAAEITRLLAENAELREKLHEEHHELVWQNGYSQGVSSEAEKWNENVKIIRDNAFEAGQVKGQNDAWELARKIVLAVDDGGYSTEELKEIFANDVYQTLLIETTYQEAAAKVAEWERKKEEICVGDVVEFEGSYGVVVGVGECYIKGFTSDWTPFQFMKKDCTKTGRHIDVDAWLAQIGDER